VDVAFAADLVGRKIREAINAPGVIRPFISSACPAVVRLIQVRFPNLVEHVLPVLSPMRAAANMAWHRLVEEMGLASKDVGVWFITPCPGKVSAVKEPAGTWEDTISGAIPIAEVYPLIREKLNHSSEQLESIAADHDFRPGSGLGLGWARSGGENQSIGGSRQIAVDGIHSVIQILEDVERGKLSDIEYIEAQACVGGCVGGVLTVENSFITRRRVRILATETADKLDDVLCDDMARKALDNEDWFRHDKPIEPRPTLKLDDDMAVAIRKMEQMERIVEDLPGLDCGSCGAPNCRALAEDVVRGLANETDCIFKLRERVRQLAEEMMELAEKAPPAMGHMEKKAEIENAIGEHSAKTGPDARK
jgi:hypothetical protein